MSGGYNEFIKQIDIYDNSTSRQVLGQTEQGKAESDAADINLVTGAISGGRLSVNFFANFNDVVRKVSSDTDTYIDNRIISAILALASVFIILVGIHFLRGFKTET